MLLEQTVDRLSIDPAFRGGVTDMAAVVLEHHWLFGTGVSLGLLTCTLLIGPFRKVLTTLEYVIIIGMLFAAVAFIIWKIAHQSA